MKGFVRKIKSLFGRTLPFQLVNNSCHILEYQLLTIRSNLHFMMRITIPYWKQREYFTFACFLFFPTLVGTGGSYLFFSLSLFLSPPLSPLPPAPDCWFPIFWPLNASTKCQKWIRNWNLSGTVFSGWCLKIWNAEKCNSFGRVNRTRCHAGSVTW